MARAFRPSVMVSVPRNYSGKFEENVSNGSIQLQFATYEQVKKEFILYDHDAEKTKE
jgi:hypothetical protein